MNTGSQHSVFMKSACQYKSFVIVTVRTHGLGFGFGLVLFFSEKLRLLCIVSFCIQLTSMFQGQDKIKKRWEGIESGM